MTRTAIYSLQENALTELPEMPEPLLPYYPKFEGNDTAYDISMRMYHTAFREYTTHLATLRTIPVHESCRSLWKDGQRLECGKDYELKKWCKDPDLCSISSCDCKEYACPIPVKSEQGEEELWEEALSFLVNNPALNYPSQIKELKSKYIITKR